MIRLDDDLEAEVAEGRQLDDRNAITKRWVKAFGSMERVEAWRDELHARLRQRRAES